MVQVRESTREDRGPGPLLTTKLYVPSARPNWIPRPRLLQRLDQGLTASGSLSPPKLTLISAPAGYGKTTLLAEWVTQTDQPVAWLSLEKSENDPARFLAYLAAALESLPGFSPLPAPADRGVPGETTLTMLVNRIGERQGPAVLILDDLHRVTAPVVYEYVAYLLDHVPPTLRLVISSRADPPLPIARLRAGGQLTEIRQADLRFSRAEAAAFLRGAAGLDLTDEQVATLASRTEGWIAGLQMAAASMARREDLGEFVQTFGGSHRYVMDYLLEEVLRLQRPEVQAFLLQTSILERLSASLCDAVLLQPPRAGSQSILEHLDQTNLFVTPLDDRRIWYRYHRLFADLLRRRLLEQYPDLPPDLHRRASQWYEEQELLPESIEHALAAEDFERSASLIERVVEPLMMRSELATLRNWLEALPDPVLYRRPQLCAYHAWLLLLGGAPLQTVESLISVMSKHPDGESGQIKAVRAVITVYQGEIEGVAAMAEEALQTLSEDDGFWYSVARWLRDLLWASDGELRGEDAQSLRRLLRTQLDSQNVLLAVVGLCHLGELRVKQGRLREAEAFFERALSWATNPGGDRLPVAGEPLVWLGDLARERNDLSTAERYLAEGLDLIRQWAPIGAIEGTLSLARLRHAQGDGVGTSEAIEEAERLSAMFDASQMDDYLVAMCRARLAALEGDFEAVEQWAASRGLDALDADDLQLDATIELHLRKYELVVLGLARVLEGRPREALEFLEPLLSWVADKGRWGVGIETLALQAVAHHMVGESGLALKGLEQALARAEPEGFVRLFLEIGDPMPRLLYQAVQRGICPDYAARLLAALPEPAESSAPAAQRQGGIESLSERELEVLVAIAEGLTNQETAQRLFISERTVKWHASNIYGKLQVSNRTKAVAKARSLGILPA